MGYILRIGFRHHEPSKISLSQYLSVHYDAFTAMYHLSAECLRAQNIDL
jgi:hypothetical protein